MKEKYNQEERQLFELWKDAEKNLENQNTNATDMKESLNQATTEFGNGLKKAVTMDMFMKSALILGLTILCFLHLENSFVVLTAGIFIFLGGLGLWFEWKMSAEWNKTCNHGRGLTDLINEQLTFYQSYLWKYPVLLAITPAMFYVLGSMIYYALVHGEIRPIKDVQDAIALSVFLIFGIVLSLAVNYPYFKSRINNLRNLIREMNNVPMD